MKVAVLGGGISGLAASHYLLKYGGPSIEKIILIEASERVGGWIHTKRFEDGVIHEVGPKSVRSAGVNGLNSLLLVEEVGLSSDIVYFARNNAAAKKRYIWYDNKMHTLPGSFASIFQRSSLLKEPLIKYIWNEFRTPRLNLSDDEDISVYDFMSRRLGEDIGKFFADPMCRGITSGDARKLSMRSMFPQIIDLAQKKGSIVKGMFSVRPFDDPIWMEARKSQLAMRSRSEKWASWSFRDGLSQLPEKIYDNLSNNGTQFDSKVGHLCEHIMFKPDGSAVVHVSNASSIKPIAVDHVISTVPSHHLAKCLSSKTYPDLCENLSSIKHVPVAVICLEYKGKLMESDRGFGFLTPSIEKPEVLGIVFDSCCFPTHDASKNITRLTVMTGGEWFEELFGDPSSVTHDKLLETSLRNVHKCLGIKDEPIRYDVNIHKECIPQYYLGHAAKLKKIENLIETHKLNLHFTGFSYRGVGVNDNILNARRTVQNFLEQHVN